MTTASSRKRKKAAPKTFEAAYHILKANAATLQQQQEPNIDDLMTIVEESISAYKVCQTRIDAVQKALDAAFSDQALADNDNSSEHNHADNSDSADNADNSDDSDNTKDSID